MDDNHISADDSRGGALLRWILFWICGSLLTLVPLAFTTGVYRAFVLPKFFALLLGSAALLVSLSLTIAIESSRRLLVALKSSYVAVVFVYLLSIGISTLGGVAPLASLFGSYQSEMGLISRLCFFVLFVGLLVCTVAVVGRRQLHRIRPFALVARRRANAPRICAYRLWA